MRVSERHCAATIHTSALARKFAWQRRITARSVVPMKASDAKALVRAAAAYAGYSRDIQGLADASGLSFNQLRRILAPSDDRAPDLEERLAIGRACGWPRDLMEFGLEAIGGDDSAVRALRDRLDTIESRIDSEATEHVELLRRIAALEAAQGDAASGGS